MSMMDFSQAYYGGAPPYQFMGIQPLTPSQTNSTGSEDFSNHSPPEVFDGYQHHEPFQHYEQYAQFNPQAAQAFPQPPGPPTPPTQHSMHRQHSVPMTSTPTPAKQHQDIQPMTKMEPDGKQGSNSDEDDMTPAQSRRKAQNRAAQRAFRERKERHVKDLEARLASLQEAQQQTATENERLKRDLQKVSTENEILRATSHMQQSQTGSMSPSDSSLMTAGPMRYNPTDFYSDLLANHTNKTPSHRIVESDGGERLLAAGATWDFIVNHELYRRGLVDVGDVSIRLKSQAKCDGLGPVFEERAILEAIEQSVASGSDTLL